MTAFDATKHGALAVVGDARATLEALRARLAGHKAPQVWSDAVRRSVTAWNRDWDAVTAAPADNALPSDAQVIGAVWRRTGGDAVVVCAAGGLPGELHKLWRPRAPGGYHLEYGFSCMGYEIAGGLGVKMADPARDVVVMVGDGSYLMLNSEIATSVMLGQKLTIVVLDNRGFGCINRLQQQVWARAPFNNLLADARHEVMPEIDFRRPCAPAWARRPRRWTTSPALKPRWRGPGPRTAPTSSSSTPVLDISTEAGGERGVGRRGGRGLRATSGGHGGARGL